MTHFAPITMSAESLAALALNEAKKAGVPSASGPTWRGQAVRLLLDAVGVLERDSDLGQLLESYRNGCRLSINGDPDELREEADAIEGLAVAIAADFRTAADYLEERQ